MALLLNSTYLLVMFPFVFCLVDQYTIIRTSTDTFSSDVDIFAIPESQCRSSASQCAKYNNAITAHDQCTCNCPPFAATFAWHDGSWSCVNNTEIRVKLGCKFKFQYEQDQDPFRILGKKQTPLPTAVLPSMSCSIDVSSSKYYKCNDKWTGLELTSSPLRILIQRKLSGSKHYMYSFRVKSVASIKGTLVSLRFKCPENVYSSCLLFKMDGESSCPVSTLQTSSTQTPLTGRSTLFHSSAKSPATDEREGSSSRSQNDALSSTAIAIVTTTIIILVIIIAVTIWFIIWKRKREESLGVIDRLTRSGKENSSKPDDNTYAEIHVHSHQGPKQTRTDALTRGIINSGLESFPTNLHQHQDPLYEDADFVLPVEQPITDSEGYSVPVDSPLYLELHPPEESVHDEKTKSDDKFKNGENEWSSSSRGGRTEDLDLPWYDVLEDPNDKSIDDGAGVDWQQEQNRNSVERDSVSGSGLSNAAGCHPRHLSKRRRRPPSPPRKGHKHSSDGDENKKHVRMTLAPDRQDITDVQNDSGRHDLYEGLKEDERVMSVYEALDRTAASI